MTDDLQLTLKDKPFLVFEAWLKRAAKHEPSDPNAFALATVGEDGMPSVRIMLLKGVDLDGFVFFTNKLSRKGQQLEQHPKAAMDFYWKSLGQQVRVEGMVTHVAEEEANAYFSSRPRGSQIGAWASQQSQFLEDRQVLENRVHHFEEQFDGKEVPRPPHWGGYRILPLRLEFWQAGEYRLHDRFIYSRQNVKDDWNLERQYP